MWIRGTSWSNLDLTAFCPAWVSIRSLNHSIYKIWDLHSYVSFDYTILSISSEALPLDWGLLFPFQLS